MPLEVARLILLSAWGVGPKVADLTILSTFEAPHFIPCDAHLRKFAARLSLAEDFRMPEKILCRRFLCSAEAAWRLDPMPEPEMPASNPQTTWRAQRMDADPHLPPRERILQIHEAAMQQMPSEEAIALITLLPRLAKDRKAGNIFVCFSILFLGFITFFGSLGF
jgi:hypothetical protein